MGWNSPDGLALKYRYVYSQPHRNKWRWPGDSSPNCSSLNHVCWIDNLAWQPCNFQFILFHLVCVNCIYFNMCMMTNVDVSKLLGRTQCGNSQKERRKKEKQQFPCSFCEINRLSPCKKIKLGFISALCHVNQCCHTTTTLMYIDTWIMFKLMIQVDWTSITQISNEKCLKCNGSLWRM